MQPERSRSRPRSGAIITAVLAAAAIFAGSTSSRAADVVFVPLGDNNEIAVIDVKANKVVERIPDMPAAHGLAKTPDGELLIAGSFAEVEPGGSPPERPAGTSAEEHAAHHAKPVDQPAAKDAAISRVSIIRTKDRAVIRRVDVPGPVHHVAASPNGLFAAVTHPNQDAVSIIDIRAFKVAAVIKTGAVPNYAEFSPDGKRLYVSDSSDNRISIIDTDKWAVTRRIAVGEGPEHFVLHPDLGRLFVNNVGDGTVSVVNLDDQTVSQVLKSGEDPHGIDISEDGRILFVSARGADKMISIDLKTGARREVSLSPQPYHLRMIEGHGVIYVSSIELPKMWIVDPKAMQVTGMIDIGGNGHQMVQ